MRVQLLGLCRFSYLGLGGFQVDHPDLEARRAFLYDPERLARRWAWFEAVTLPGLTAQTDPDFTLVLMTGPDLPQPWLGRLRAVVAARPQFRLALLPPLEHHRTACARAVAPHRDPAADVVAHFRQDDDDAVAVDYVARARGDFAAVAGEWRQAGAAAVSYPRGLVLEAVGAGGARILPLMIPCVSAGLTIYLPPDDGRTAVHIRHDKVAGAMPLALRPGRAMFCRGRTGTNDSGDVGRSRPWRRQPSGAELDALLAQRFGIDRGALDAAAARQSGPGRHS